VRIASIIALMIEALRTSETSFFCIPETCHLHDNESSCFMKDVTFLATWATISFSRRICSTDLFSSNEQSNSHWFWSPLTAGNFSDRSVLREA
jgi:hypothetical protein